jgi:hypothetical protein
MKLYTCLFIILLAATIAEAQQLEPFGLQDKTVTAMHYYWGSLYAATENDGVYRRALGELDSGWVALGVPAKNPTSIFAFHTVCPLVCWKGILVGSILNLADGDSALIYFYQQRPDTCTKKGQWPAADSGMDRAQLTQINAISGIDVCQPVGPQYVIAFAAARNSIWRSQDRGKSWQPVWQLPNANFFAFATKGDFFLPSAGKVWAGGYAEIGPTQRPLILYSADSGEHWENRTPEAPTVPDGCWALAIHPTDTNTVYAALTHAIAKTQDGGKNWVLTSLQEQSVTFTTLAVNPQRPSHVLAGGVVETNLFALYESIDGGDHWQTFRLRDPLYNGVSSLVFDPTNSQFAYVSTLGTGVFRYSGATTHVAHEQNTPKGFRLSPNFPNPVYLTQDTRLTFRVDLPVADRVTIRLFNIMGQEMAAWQMALAAGEQNIALPVDPLQLPAGVYFIQAEWRGQRVTRKWMGVR